MADDLFRIEATVLSPQPFTGEHAVGEAASIGAALTRATTSLQGVLKGRKPKNRMLVQFDVTHRPAKRTGRFSDDAPRHAYYDPNSHNTESNN
jgi:hypothetical protein